MLIQPPYLNEISESLVIKYNNFNHHNRANPLDELLFIICSLKTQEGNYRGTYSSLKKAFPTFSMLSKALPEEIERVIIHGGLEKQKSQTIYNIMQAIIKVFGKPTLSPLKRMEEDKCEKFLLSLKGVGVKTARCVMMYSLNMKVFPIDSHIWRITKRLGWNTSQRDYRSCSDREMDVIQELIPPDLRHSLHVNFVSLGRDICTSQKPKCDMCPINIYCPKIGVVVKGNLK